MKISVILFDLGSTLIYSTYPWPAVFEKADQVMFDRLADSGVNLDRSSLVKEFIAFLDAYYQQRDVDLIERSMDELLKTFLASKGFTGLPNSEIRAALDVMFEITQTNWFIEEDALSTLSTLREAGFRLGLISNASDDKNVQLLIDRHKLRPHFLFAITSATVGVRKPHPKIFQTALDFFRVPADQTVMVGDNMEADIDGANRMGMYSVWITKRASKYNPNIHPNATVQSLAEVPPLMFKMD